MWYLPTFYGDIRLERLEGRTKLFWENLTAREKTALSDLKTRADKKNWGKLVLAAGEATLDVKLDVVRKLLTKALKPGRQIVDIVKFSSGEVEEVTHSEPDKVKVRDAVERLGGLGASVAKPTLGCPEPRLKRAELRAREVLFAFLDADQQEDFTARNAFVTEGAGTGHRYMVTSRHANDVLAQTRRQLYDLDEKRPYCVHDYAVPAAEEMLALHLLLQIPEHERYLRHLERAAVV
jgi:hypothetical protein